MYVCARARERGDSIKVWLAVAFYLFKSLVSCYYYHDYVCELYMASQCVSRLRYVLLIGRTFFSVVVLIGTVKKRRNKRGLVSTRRTHTHILHNQCHLNSLLFFATAKKRSFVIHINSKHSSEQAKWTRTRASERE